MRSDKNSSSRGTEGYIRTFDSKTSALHTAGKGSQGPRSKLEDEIELVFAVKSRRPSDTTSKGQAQSFEESNSATIEANPARAI